MPIYEYRCKSCERKSEIFLRSIGSAVEPACQHCGSKELQRLVSSFGIGLTDQQVHERTGPLPAKGVGSPDFYKDPRNIGRWTEEKFNKAGVDLPGDIKERISAAREGSVTPTERP